MQSKKVIKKLKSLSDPEAVAGMARFGINPENTLGVSIPNLRKMAKEIGKDHQLARELWASGIHEARILAGMVDDPKAVDEKQAEEWVKDFDSWDVCDQVCMNLFWLTPFAYQKCYEWSSKDEEFVKRAGFALMSRLAWSDKKAEDKEFIKFLPVIKREATDERNFVKKAVNWALRQIGKRNVELNKQAVKTAKEIQKLDSKSARWIAADALKKLAGEAEKAVTMSIARLRIQPVPPFDFDLSAMIFSDGDPRTRSYDGKKYRHVLRVSDRPVLFIIKSTGTVNEPRLSVELKSRKELSPADKEVARQTVYLLLNLDMDLKPFYRAMKKDPVMARVVKNLHGLKSPTTPTVFEALTDSITEQQISLVAAHSMQRKLIRAFGEKLMLDGETYYAFPTPEKLAGASLSGLRACGLSGRKSEYIKDISTLVAGGKLDLEKFKEYESNGEIIDELCGVRGIGVWTAEMTMIRGLQKMDALPADDLGLQVNISHFYRKGGRLKSDELRKIAENWGKWRGLAGFYLLVAYRIGLE